MTEETNKASGEYVLAVIRASADELPDTHAAPLDEAARFVSALIAERDALRTMLQVMCDKFDGRMGDWENAEFHDEYNEAIALIARTSPGAPK